MLAAAKEETFSALSGPGVLFPLAACEGVGKKPRQGFGRKNVALHRGSALPNSRTALRDRGSLARNSRRMSLLPQSRQAPCSAKIQAAVQSDLNPTSLTNLGPTSGPGLDSSGMRGGAYNVNFFETGVTLGPPGTATAIPGTTCGRFSDGLHIPIPGAPGCPDLNDPTIFTGESAVYNNMSGFFFTAHIDSGNANTFFGAIQHFFIDVILGNLGFHHGC